MRPRVKIQVCGYHLARLRKIYEETTCPRTGRGTQMVLLSHDGYSVEENAKITRKSDDTARYWLHRFQQTGGSDLIEAPHTGRPPQIKPIPLALAFIDNILPANDSAIYISGR